MKPRHYIKKYRLDETEQYDRRSFMTDFTSDFMATVEIAQGHTDFNLTHWDNLVRQMRMKFDGIVNKSKGTQEAWEKTWKYFYATVVVKMRDQFFGEVIAKKKAAAKAKWERDREYRESMFGGGGFGFNRSFYEEFIYNFFKSSFKGMEGSRSAPTDAFVTLGLPETATADQIKESFRKLALVTHSDKGGSDDKMHDLIQARNQCLAYAG